VAETRATPSTDELERFLAKRAPDLAPPDLADVIVLAVTGLPQLGAGRLVRWPTRRAVRPALLPMAAVLAVAVLLALVALAVIGRPAPRPVAPTWTRVSLGGPSSIAWVAGGGMGSLLAATWPDGNPGNDMVWRSADGATFAPIADQSPFADASVGGFLQGKSSVLAYGSRNGVPAGSPATIATWESDDGATWRLLSASESTNPVAGQIAEHLASVVAGGPGYVGVGSVATADSLTWAAFSSPDGKTWTRSPSFRTTHVETHLGGPAALGPSAAKVGVVRSLDGFLAVSPDASSLGIQTWSSHDGVGWTRGPVISPSEVFMQLAYLANLPGGMPLGAIAAYTTIGPNGFTPTVSVTRDGQTWTQLAVPMPPIPCHPTPSDTSCGIVATAIAADADHVVLTGETNPDNGDGHPVVWTSADGGRTWDIASELSPDASAGAQDGVLDLYAGGPNSFLAVGSGADGAAAWFGHPFPTP